MEISNNAITKQDSSIENKKISGNVIPVDFSNGQNDNYLGALGTEACDSGINYGEDGLQESVNLLFESLNFKEEKARDGKGGYIFKEILSTFGDYNTEEAINILKATNNTFEFFKKVSDFVFKEVQKNNEKLSLNIFLKDISNKNFIPYLNSLENKYQIDKSKIVFEILENNYGDLNFIVINNLIELQNRGYESAIDDLDLRDTKDNNSLETIQRLSKIGYTPNYAKIDGKFLRTILESLDSIEANELKKFIKTLKSLGIIVIGEWIENLKKGLIANQIGIDYYQGMFLNDENFIFPEYKSKSFKLTNTIKGSFQLMSDPLDPSFTINNTIKSFALYNSCNVAELIKS